MKPYILFSDFDGTMSTEDFYLRYAKRHLSTLDAKLLAQYRAGTLSSYDYLDQMLNNINASPKEIAEHVNDLKMEAYIEETVALVQKHGGDFTVISAGSSLYIKPVLDKMGLHEIPLYANGGTFIDGGIKMSTAEDERFYHSFYGIDKAKVVESQSKHYQTTIYAGDGSSDFEAAKLCHIRFGKRSLARRLKEAGLPFYPFDTYHDIYLKLSSLLHQENN